MGAPSAPGIGERVTALRERLGLSQAELCRRSGVSRSHLSMIESGDRVQLAGLTLGKLATGLGVTIEELLRDG